MKRIGEEEEEKEELEGGEGGEGGEGVLIKCSNPHLASGEISTNFTPYAGPGFSSLTPKAMRFVHAFTQQIHGFYLNNGLSKGYCPKLNAHRLVRSV